VVTVLAAVNWAVQVARKPAELVGALGLTEPKPPRITWEAYGPVFRAHATPLVPPAVLAALAQVESAGDPHARTFWRWRWSWSPLEWYRPASSAVGLYQMTDGAFDEARRLCVHEGRVLRTGAWHDLDGCWLTGLYTRLVPGHAVELTAARLHVHLERLLAGPPPRRATPDQRRDLAAVVHLCGPGRGATFARRGFRAAPGERCGTHPLQAYLARVRHLTATFARGQAFDSLQPGG
jgi:hypothetical protein